MRFIKLAIKEQRKCNSFPRVGTVVFKDGKLLSKAYRAEKESLHAERIALEKLTQEETAGATLITTLEPCVKINANQKVFSCADLIVNRGIAEVVIGILDPNGAIYCEGSSMLLKNGIVVNYFPPRLREEVEANTFKNGSTGIGYGPSGRTRLGIVGEGTTFKLQFSKTDSRIIEFKWSTLQYQHGCIDLIYENKSVTKAQGRESFEQIPDPSIFRELSHFARMHEGEIAVVKAPYDTFATLIKLDEISETSILFSWQTRNR